MNAVLSFLGQRRKAVAAVLGASAELIAEAIPQTNSQNAMLLHSVLAVISVWLVHVAPNDPAPADHSIGDFLNDVVRGDHAAPAAPSLQG